MNGTIGDGARQTTTISRNGDLISRMYFQATLGAHVQDNPGALMIDNVVCEIGGQQIDKHSGFWMEAWSELTEPNPSGSIGECAGALGTRGTLFQNMSGMGGVAGTSDTPVIYVPLQFWFCRNPGLALPLIALQYHEVKLIVTWNSATASAPTACELFVDYIYLDTDERRRFAQVSHEYLIEQVQEQSLAAATTNDLNFNHPVKELVWVADTAAATGLRGDMTDNNYFVKLNGHDRFAKRPLQYFTRTQIWQHHTGTGGLLSTATSAYGQQNDSIAVYSFALKPEEHQPSGTCNFSRIDNAQLVCDAAAATGLIFAVNYNVLRIMSGMGGLAYSN
jgi:hypothetical protein